MKSNKKRILFVLAILTMAIVLSCAFVACDKTGSQKSDYKITVHPNNGQADFVWDVNADIPVITKDGYHITGYYLDAEMTISTTLESLKATELTKNIDVYVKWEKHVEVIDAAVEPTCTEKGLTEGKHCSKCGKILTAQTEIDALGHDLENHDEQEATCTEKGWKAYVTCKREGCEHTTYEEIPALGHTGGTATCTEQATCERCNEKYGELAKHKYKDNVCVVCGAVRPSEGLEYSLSSDGTGYIVSGIGTCTDKELIIPSEYNAKPVTSIGDGAFAGCTGLTSATIPDSVTSIGNSAFSGCSSLESITIPFVGAKSGVTNSDTYQYPLGYIFGTSSYAGGIATTQYYYGNSTSSTTYDTYYIPSSLKSVTVTGGNILYGAFYKCTGLTSITIPDSVTSIGSSAFYGCTGITSITIPDSVTSIGWVAFSRCNKLQDIYITDIAAWCNISGLDNLMSYGSSNKKLYINNELATSITIPNGVTEIPSSSFYNCTGLTSATIPNSVTSIGDFAFRGCTGLTSVTIPDSVTSIGRYAFYNCTGLTNITIPDSVTIIGEGAFYNTAWYNNQPDGLVYAGKVAYTYKGTMPSNTSIVLKEGTLGIAGSAFYDCDGLTSVTIGGSVTSIGDCAFAGCTGLTSITIPNSVTSIGSSAFEGCKGLTSVTIPNSVTSIGRYAFQSCAGLTSVTIGNGVTYIGESAFRGCIGLTNITIPDSVTIISWGAFSGCIGLTNITIPDSVTIIGRGAFSGCSSLKSITIPFVGAKAGVTSSDTYQYPFGYIFDTSRYDGGVATEQYYYGSSTSSTTSTTYYIPSSLKSVTVTSGNILYGAFYGCAGLTSVTIGNGVTYIGESAFLGCTGLTTVNWNATACTTAGSSNYPMFKNCSKLTIINIGNKVTTIPSYAFYGCSGLTSVTIPDSVKKIGEYAFSGCNGLMSITFNGTIAQWKSISKGTNWKQNVPATEVVCTDGTVSI